jgi:hypothetical protein
MAESGTAAGRHQTWNESNLDARVRRGKRKTPQVRYSEKPDVDSWFKN